MATGAVGRWLKFCVRFSVCGLYLLLIIVVILATVDLYQNGADKHILAWYTAGIFCCLAVPISVHEIFQHLLCYEVPRLQRYVVRILWLVPIYSVDSWLALRFKNGSMYFDAMRGCYEAFVIYCFTQFLIAFLGDENLLIHTLTEKTSGKSKQHLFPVSLFLESWQDGRLFLKQCKKGCLQYVLLKIFCSMLALVTQYYGYYSEGDLFNPKCGYFWATWIDNFSCFWALYALALFYHACYEELKPIKPFPKFLCVKMVVFFSFWQSLVIDVLVHMKVITHTVTHSTDDVARATQNWLICGEMFVASICFSYAFSHKDFLSRLRPSLPLKSATATAKDRPNFFSALFQSSLLVPLDVIQDTHGLFYQKSSRTYQEKEPLKTTVSTSSEFKSSDETNPEILPV